jgi:two-component system sensor histidine kinase ChiS
MSQYTLLNSQIVKTIYFPATMSSFKRNLISIPCLSGIWIFILSCNIVVYSQDKTIDFEKYSVGQGLSNLSVHALLQDNQGFIWIGTQGGLGRFDGYKFVNYYSDPFDKTTLSDNYITCLKQGKDGSIWAGTRKGICNLNKYNNIVRNYNVPDGQIFKKLHEYILCLHEERKGNLWVGTKGGLLYFDFKEKKFTEIRLDSTLIPKKEYLRVNDIQSDKNGNLWIGTSRGIYFYNTTIKKAIKKLSDPQNIVRLCLDQNLLWIATGAGVFNLDIITSALKTYYPSATGNNDIYCMLLNSKNELLVGTLEGIKKFDPKTNQFVRFFENERVISWYQSNRSQALLEDSNQTYWIATFSDGLYHYDPSPPKFQHYKYVENDPFSLQDNAVYGLCEVRNGDVWVGTSTDLSILKKDSGKFIRYSDTPTGMIWRIYEDSEGIVWAGGRAGLIESRPDGRSSFYGAKSGSQNAGRVSAIYEDHQKVMWFGGRDGLYTYDKTNKKFIPFPLPIITPDSVQINHIIEDKKHQIWIASTYGLYKIDSTRNDVKFYIKDEQNINSPSDNNYSGILLAKDGQIYASSINYGLNRFNSDKETFSHFRTKDGLPDEKLWGLAEDHHGFIWITTSKGMSRFDPRTKSFLNFDIYDGLQSYEFSNISFHKGRYSNKIYFGGINGFNVFHPDSLKYNRQIPNPRFTSLKYRIDADRSSEYKDVPGIFLKNKLILPAGTDIINIEFSAFNFRQSFKNQYKYILEGVNQKWIDLGFKPEISLIGLSHGNYTLKVLASNNDGQWSKEPLELFLTIKPYWWQMLWFKALLVILIIWFVYLFIQYSLNKRLEMEKIRTQIASDLHDEVGSMLSGLAMQSELLLSGDRKDSVSKLENISLISRSVISKMRDLVWSIDSRRDSMDSLLEKMEEQAADLFHPMDIGFKIERGVINPKKKMSVLARQQVFMIFNEAITNVVRHSDATFVHIKVGNFGDYFELSVHDNGSSNPLKKVHKAGMGTSNMMMRADKLNGKLTITNQKGYCIKLIMNKV